VDRARLEVHEPIVRRASCRQTDLEESGTVLLKVLSLEGTRILSKPEPTGRIRARAVFREVNKRIRDLTRSGRFDGPTQFLCECDDPACVATIELTLEEFEAIRWRENVYIVKAGHERPHGEWIIEKTLRFVLVKRSAETSAVGGTS
jgi:hypothetical protein